jgi:hypothetical protein
MALTALTTPPVPRLRRIFPDVVRSKLRGPRLEAMTKDRWRNKSRTSFRKTAFRCLMVSAGVSDWVIKCLHSLSHSDLSLHSLPSVFRGANHQHQSHLPSAISSSFKSSIFRAAGNRGSFEPPIAALWSTTFSALLISCSKVAPLQALGRSLRPNRLAVIRLFFLDLAIYCSSFHLRACAAIGHKPQGTKRNEEHEGASLVFPWFAKLTAGAFAAQRLCLSVGFSLLRLVVCSSRSPTGFDTASQTHLPFRVRRDRVRSH